MSFVPIVVLFEPIILSWYLQVSLWQLPAKAIRQCSETFCQNSNYKWNGKLVIAIFAYTLTGWDFKFEIRKEFSSKQFWQELEEQRDRLAFIQNEDDLLTEWGWSYECISHATSVYGGESFRKGGGIVFRIVFQISSNHAFGGTKSNCNKCS